MFLAILYKTQILQPEQKAVAAVEEQRDGKDRIIQEAKPAVAAREAITREVMRQVYVEDDPETVAKNLASGAHHIEYFRITHIEEGKAPQLSPVTLSKERKRAPARELVEIECDGQVIASTEV